MAAASCAPPLISALESIAAALQPASAALVVLSSGKNGDQSDLHAIEIDFALLKTVLVKTKFKNPVTPMIDSQCSTRPNVCAQCDIL